MIKKASSESKPSEPYWIRCKLSTGLDSEIDKRDLPIEKKSDEYTESRKDFYIDFIHSATSG